MVLKWVVVEYWTVKLTDQAIEPIRIITGYNYTNSVMFYQSNLNQI
jgi:hypothetical protein